MKNKNEKKLVVERITEWMGSVPSLAVHSVLFVCSFAIGFFGIATWDTVLLGLTTIVSLEAIYLAIFIQMTVNRQAQSLREVEDDIDDIQEHVEDIQEDVKEISEDVEDIQEDEEEDEEHRKKQTVTLETLSRDMALIVKTLEELKKK
jgi:ABC-type siderophore export system fused ATPase/permease subunit